MKSRVHEITTFEDGSLRLMARLVGLDGEPIVPDDVASIAWQTWPKATTDEASGSGTLEPADVLFAELQDEAWTADATGYNFRWDAPATLFPAPRRETLAVRFTLAGDPAPIVHLLASVHVLRTEAG